MSSDTTEFGLEIPDGPVVVATPEVLPPAPDPGPQGLAISGILPEDFNLQLLLRFLPDVSMKRELDRLTAAALAIDVTAPGGLQLADEALVPCRRQMDIISEGFSDPCSLANRLHKRLTGLRADFLEPGELAVPKVEKRIRDEKARLDREAADARKAAQDLADQQAREEAKRVADEARKAGAPKPVVAALKEAAKSAAAPPVHSPVAAPQLRNSTTVQNWKARPVGDPDAEPNPDTSDMTPAQQEAMMLLVRAIAEGRAPLSLVNVDWSAANARAKAEKSTMAIPGLEAYDHGTTRGKRR